MTTSNGDKVAVGIPNAHLKAAESNAYADIPLGRPGTASEVASATLAVASPLFSYVNGQTIMVSSLCYAWAVNKSLWKQATGGRNM